MQFTSKGTTGIAGHRPVLAEMSERSREIFRQIVDAYVETGEPVGSRTLSRRLGHLSPATIRNVMADLEEMGLLEQRHTSAGRVPTPSGLRFFIDSLLKVRGLTPREKEEIRERVIAERGAFDSVNGVITVAVTPPVLLAPGDLIGYTQMRENCGGERIALRSSVPAPLSMGACPPAPKSAPRNSRTKASGVRRSSTSAGSTCARSMRRPAVTPCKLPVQPALPRQLPCLPARIKTQKISRKMTTRKVLL